MIDYVLNVAVGIAAAGPEEQQENDRSLRLQWRTDVEAPARAAGLAAPRLVILQAHYRAMHKPLLALLGELGASEPDRSVTVLIPEAGPAAVVPTPAPYAAPGAPALSAREARRTRRRRHTRAVVPR
jgi:hypothetical protein